MPRLRYDPHRDYYDLLGVSPTASTAEIQRAFRQRAKDLHPDRNPDRQTWATVAFQALNEAYKVLSDPALRRRYDDLRWPHVTHKSAAWEVDNDSGWGWAGVRWDYDEWLRQQAPPAAPPPPPGFEPTANPWKAMQAVLRGPYRSMIWVALFIFGFFGLLAVFVMGGRAQVVVTLPTAPILIPATPTLHTVTRPPRATPTLPAPTCERPGVTISDPAEGARVQPPFSLYGSADVPGFWEYRVELAYLGGQTDPTRVRREWTLLGEPSRQPVTDGVLVEVVSLHLLEPGYYVLRLTVQQEDGTFLPPCERLVLYQRGTR